MKRRTQTWNPLEQVGATVDAIIAPPSQRQARTKRVEPTRPRQVGRPRVEGRRRLIASIGKEQFKKLRQLAVDRDVDISTVVRDALAKAGF